MPLEWDLAAALTIKPWGIRQQVPDAGISQGNDKYVSVKSSRVYAYMFIKVTAKTRDK